MNVLVDTSVWSLALRRDKLPDLPEVDALARLMADRETVFTTGLILQELFQGIRGPKNRDRVRAAFSKLTCVVPSVADHFAAAELWTHCRRRGTQVGTIDVLIAQLAIEHRLHLLTTDRDFARIAKHTPLQLMLP